MAHQQGDTADTRLTFGRYVLDPIVFKELDRQTRGAGNEIQLTDALSRTIGQVPFHGYRFEGKRYDCGTRVGFIEANVAFGLAHPEMGSRLRPILEKLLKK